MNVIKERKCFLPWGCQLGPQPADWLAHLSRLWKARAIGWCKGGGPGCSGGRGASRNVGAVSAAGADPIGWKPYEGYPSDLEVKRHLEWPKDKRVREGNGGRWRSRRVFRCELYSILQCLNDKTILQLLDTWCNLVRISVSVLPQTDAGYGGRGSVRTHMICSGKFLPFNMPEWKIWSRKNTSSYFHMCLYAKGGSFTDNAQGLEREKDEQG